MQIVNCEKHRLPSYYLDNGNVKHTCTVCYPIKKQKMNPKQKIQNYGYNDIISGEFCDQNTLNLLKDNCYITVRAPTDMINEVCSDYHTLKGVEPNTNYIREDIAETSWMLYSYKMSFYYKKEMNFNSNLKLIERNNKHTIYSNVFAGFLLDNGFKLGYN